MPQTPIVPGARILLEPRLMPGDDATRLYVLVWEDGTGGRVEVSAGPDADLQHWVAESAAAFHGVPLIDRRDDLPPPADHSCAWCPDEVRGLYAVAHNAAGAQQRAYDGAEDWTRARRKVAELAEAVEHATPGIEAHFAATTAAPAREARSVAPPPTTIEPVTRYVLTTRSVVPMRHGLVFGGVVIDPPPTAEPGRIWLHLNVMGSRIPQQYRATEVEDATDDLLAQHDLCKTCRGYGLTATALSLVETIEPPCPTCGGSGRTDLRVDIEHHPGGTVAYLRRTDGRPL